MTSLSTHEQKTVGMTEDEYALFRDLIEKEFGIVMKGDKRLTLHTKLSHRLSILDIRSYKDYYDFIISEPSKEEFYSFMAHITNNETYFQRELGRITLVAGLLDDIKRQRQKKDQKRITFLSAGCSTGEEAYTLKIMLMETGLFAWGWEVKVIGIDVSRSAVKKARNAVYTKNSFRRLDGTDEFSQKYFDRRGDLYTLKSAYRSQVEFRHGNILDPASWGGIQDIDVIFCRNVLIYMSDNAIGRITENFYRHLADEGYLFIGSSESLLNKTDLLVPECRESLIIYRKNLKCSPKR
ncbi:MAG TPA: CheR family methyltransferase [Thermodesulfovibrionales bacterium]|nr:CheR family methyltransferase [Thermodesulfovibrionales bacterium]